MVVADRGKHYARQKLPENTVSWTDYVRALHSKALGESRSSLRASAEGGRGAMSSEIFLAFLFLSLQKKGRGQIFLNV